MARIKFKRESIEREIAANPAAASVIEAEGKKEGDFVWLDESSVRKFAPNHPVFARIEQMKQGRRQVQPRPDQPPAPADGPGTELKKILEARGFKILSNCKCRERVDEMNRRGVEWCRQNREKIMGWLREECERRGIPFWKWPARACLELALARSPSPPRVL